MRAIKILCLCAISTFFLPTVASAATIIHAGRLIDGVSDNVVRNVSIVIKDGRITAVERTFIAAGPGDTIIDLKNHSVLPGLMDMHTHLSTEFSRKTYLERFQLGPAERAFRSVNYAERTLWAGFTTVRDLGDAFNVTVALRDAVNKGDLIGPRIFTAGKSIATTGGHADPTNGWALPWRGDPGPKAGVVNGPYEAAKAVRQRYKDGSDLIKITATGGVLSVAKSGKNPQFTQEELNAIVATAKDYDFKVAAHAHGEEGMKRAVIAGVASIEHGTYMTKEVMDLMKKHDTYYVPTILAGKWVQEKSKIDGFFPEVVRPKAAVIGPQIQKTFAQAYKAGVNIVFGTDSGVSAHGDNAQEFAYMVEAGMPPMEAIQSATSVAAKFLNVQDDLGSIEVGKLADIIAVPGNPVDNIKSLENVVFDMKDGVVYRQD